MENVKAADDAGPMLKHLAKMDPEALADREADRANEATLATYPVNRFTPLAPAAP